MPDISVCKICESTLKQKIEDLGKVANDAVFHHDLKETVEDNERETVEDNERESDEESETDDCSDDGADELEVQSGEEVDKRAINSLLQRIRMRQRSGIP